MKELSKFTGYGADQGGFATDCKQARYPVLNFAPELTTEGFFKKAW